MTRAPTPAANDRARAKLTATMASAKSASERHVVLAVPIRAAERNRRVAASVLAGGLAYRLFLWLLPFGLIVGGALGFLNADSTERAAEGGGLLLVALLSVAPLAGLWLWVSLHLPHGDAPWQALPPGALLVAIGLQVLHEVVVIYLVPKLETSTSLYGTLGFATTIIFFVYLIATLVVASPILNSSLHEELS